MSRKPRKGKAGRPPDPKPNTTTLEQLQQHPIIFQGQAVVTLEMVDRLHGRPASTAKRNFSHNRRRFVEGRDFWDLATEYDFRTQLKAAGFLGSRARGAIVLSERGYTKLTKAFTDERSWQIMDALVDTYFRAREQVTELEPIAHCPHCGLASEISTSQLAQLQGDFGDMVQGLIDSNAKALGLINKFASLGGAALGFKRWHCPENPHQLKLPIPPAPKELPTKPRKALPGGEAPRGT